MCAKPLLEQSLLTFTSHLRTPYIKFTDPLGIHGPQVKNPGSKGYRMRAVWKLKNSF